MLDTPMLDTPMLALRSTLFNIAFYLNTLVLMILGLPTMIVGPRSVIGLAKVWGRSSLWLARTICGLHVDFRGRANIPAGGFILAAKHQSFFETFALVTLLDDFSYILKRELTWIPLFGWYLLRARQIALARGKRGATLIALVRKARAVIAQGRTLLIFPEGTRRPVDAPPIYKAGIAHLYVGTQAPCLPVAHNAGLFWPRRSFLRKPGTILVEFLPVIPPGLGKAAFQDRLIDAVESGTNRLVAESRAHDPRLAASGGS